MSVSSIPLATRKQSLHNLCSASNGESNAVARYNAFAVQADKEGYLKIGSLFRAVAHSENIHAANHTATMMKLGGSCLSAIEPAEVKSTVENLKTAIAGGVHKVNQVFPGFIREAEAQSLIEARRTLTYAIASERGHIQLFHNALEQIEDTNPNTAEILSHKQGYYVCPACGFTTENGHFDACAVCGHARNEFDMVD